MATITTITSAGYQAALNNTPNANGYRVEIKYADVYVGKTKKGRFETKGVRISNHQLRVRATITSSGESYSYTEVRLIDGISGVEFAIIKDDNGGVLDFVSADKKSTFTTTIATTSLPNDRITIVQDDGNSVALAELDAHKNDENAHKALFDKKMDKTDFNSAISNKADKTTTLTAGNGLTGGGALSENRTFALGTPSSITATSTNSVSATSHSHAIDKASTTTAGIVKLNNTLTSTATNEALTALQGKTLAEQVAAAVSGSLNLKGQLVTQNLDDLHSDVNYGVWQNNANVNATAERNYPTLKAGALLVLPSAYKGQQIYFPFDDKGIHIRDTRSNAATPAWGDWYKLAAPENVLTSTSTTSPLSAAMGKKLNDEKLGNSGTQTLAGVLNINMPNQWAAMHFQTKSGYWRFETNPAGDSASNGMRFNYVFTGADNTEKSRIAFPESVGTSTVAYQSWVNENLENKDFLKTINFADIATATYTKSGFYRGNGKRINDVATPSMEMHIAHPSYTNNAYARGIGFGYGGSFALTTTSWDKDGNYLGQKAILTEENGVTLSGNQTINGTKTFSGSLTTQSTVRFSHSSKGVFGALGMGAADVYLHNPTSNKYLQMKDDGVLAYSNDKIMLYSDRSDEINLDRTDKLATSRAVKKAYDKANEATPSGTVAFFAMRNAPAGWLKCNGAAVSRSTYSALFAAIGTTFGAGNGSTTFNLPDLRGEFIRGFDDGRNVDGGRGLGAFQGDAIRNITGKFQAVVKGHATEQTVGQADGAFYTSRHYNPLQGADSSLNDWAREYVSTRLMCRAQYQRLAKTDHAILRCWLALKFN